jgi:hypothetical protein
MIQMRNNQVKKLVFSAFQATLKREKDMYLVNTYDKQWLKAVTHHRQVIFSSFMSRMSKEVRLGKTHKKIFSKYRKQGLQMYWQWIKTRYIKNVAIKAHKHEKPLTLKHKCFMAIKGRYMFKKQ